jgi:hypothetical protein
VRTGRPPSAEPPASQGLRQVVHFALNGIRLGVASLAVASQMVREDREERRFARPQALVFETVPTPSQTSYSLAFAAPTGVVAR